MHKPKTTNLPPPEKLGKLFEDIDACTADICDCLSDGPLVSVAGDMMENGAPEAVTTRYMLEAQGLHSRLLQLHLMVELWLRPLDLPDGEPEYLSSGHAAARVKAIIGGDDQEWKRRLDALHILSEWPHYIGCKKAENGGEK